MRIKPQQRNPFCQKFANAILNDCAAVFVGAGMSIPCGLPSWRELLRTPLEEIELNADKETDLITVAQYYTNVKNRRSDLTHHVISQFLQKKPLPSAAHKLLAALPIKQIWTTNYDSLLEQALESQGKRVDVKRKAVDMCYPVPQRDVVVYKMHGDITLPSEITLISDDYESYRSRNELFVNALKTDLATKSFLFIGFSMSDPNILGMLSDMKQMLGKHVRQHYCIYKNIQEADIGEECNFEYEQKRENLWIENLKRYGIEIIRIDDYAEIETILKIIKQKVLSRSIFISGSAEEYGALPREDAEAFMHNLAYRLAERGYKIVSGFGLGVGNSIINGVLTYAYEQGQTIEGKLLTHPFPQNIKDANERKRKWSKYRKDIISQAGIAIFIFGNKTEKTSSSRQHIINAAGVEEEFEIAKEQNLILLPIAQTNYAAKKIAGLMANEMERFYATEELRNAITIMNQIPIDKYEQLVDSIIKCIDEAQKA